MSTGVEQRGPGVWDMRVEWLEPDDLVPNPENPNVQTDREFNALVKSIQDDGWTKPVEAVWDPTREKYEIVAGEHRWRAARVLVCKVPTLILPAEEWHRDRRDWGMVKDNILHGSLDPTKFTRLYERLAQKYDAEVLQTLMGFTSEEAFKRVYKEVVDALPPGIAEALKASQGEIKTIDDLSAVLNRLFRDHGETLDSNYMVFSWGGKDVLWVRADGPLWKTATALAEQTHESGGDLADVLRQAIDRSLRPQVGGVSGGLPEPGDAPRE